MEVGSKSIETGLIIFKNSHKISLIYISCSAHHFYFCMLNFLLAEITQQQSCIKILTKTNS